MVTPQDFAAPALTSDGGWAMSADLPVAALVDEDEPVRTTDPLPRPARNIRMVIDLAAVDHDALTLALQEIAADWIPSAEPLMGGGYSYNYIVRSVVAVDACALD